MVGVGIWQGSDRRGYDWAEYGGRECDTPLALLQPLSSKLSDTLYLAVFIGLHSQ